MEDATSDSYVSESVEYTGKSLKTSDWPFTTELEVLGNKNRGRFEWAASLRWVDEIRR